jgi:hypothetical protein
VVVNRDKGSETVRLALLENHYRKEGEPMLTGNHVITLTQRRSIMNATKSLGVAMVILAVFSMALTAEATTITNLTTGTVLFSDDYEGLGTNVSHATPFQDDGDFDPVTSVGAWTTIVEQRQDYIQVTDSVLGTDPGAYQGNNYLRVLRTGDNNIAVPTASSPQTTQGEVIHFETMFYVSQIGDSPGVASVALRDPADVLLSLTGMNVSGDILNYNAGWNSTTLSFNVAEWNKLEVDYVVGATDYTVTVNGLSESNLPISEFSSGAGGAVGNVRIGSAKRVEYCLDAVPEPSTAILLLGIGLLGLTRRKRNA